MEHAYGNQYSQVSKIQPVLRRKTQSYALESGETFADDCRREGGNDGTLYRVLGHDKLVL